MEKCKIFYLSLCLVVSSISHGMNEEQESLYEQQQEECKALEEALEQQNFLGYIEHKEKLLALHKDELEGDEEFKQSTDLVFECGFDFHFDIKTKLFMMNQHIKRGALVHSDYNTLGQFPLIVECQGEANPGAVALLIRHGADAKQADRQGNTAYYYAQERLRRVEQKISELEAKRAKERRMNSQDPLSMSLRLNNKKKADIVKVLEVLSEAEENYRAQRTNRW